MKLAILFGFCALLVAAVNAAPTQVEVVNPAIAEVADQAIIDEIMKTLKEEGTAAAKKIVEDLLQDAQGALKDLLLKVLQQIIIMEIEGKLKYSDAYILDVIGIDMDQIRAILNELAEHGKQAAIELARKMLEHAKGIMRDMIIRLLQQLLERYDDTYILDIIGIDMSQIQAILRELAEHGKQAAIQLAKNMLAHAKGIMKDMIIKLLEQLERSNDAYFLDIIGIDMSQIQAILRELAEHGKQAAIQLAKNMLAHAKGIMKDMIIKLLEQLERSNDAYILDVIGIDMDQIRAILNELAEHGKQAAIELARKMLEHAKGIMRDMIIRLLQQLLER